MHTVGEQVVVNNNRVKPKKPASSIYEVFVIFPKVDMVCSIYLQAGVFHVYICNLWYQLVKNSKTDSYACSPHPKVTMSAP